MCRPVANSETRKHEGKTPHCTIIYILNGFEKQFCKRKQIYWV